MDTTKSLGGVFAEKKNYIWQFQQTLDNAMWNNQSRIKLFRAALSVVKILYVISIEDAKYYLEPDTIPQFVVLF